MKNTDYFSNVLTLTKTTLEDSDIQKDIVLCSILERIKMSALKEEFFYDYKKEFQPAVSRFTIRNGFSTPKVLLDLFSVIHMPKAWSGL
ncbi:bacteriocin immunity protein [Enterococcus sp. AZ072]|uniref:bacteriocin immunity protein n=1 Tax=unclassified Enterococcus TaxID=2608891 RepID=UPI003D26D869